MDSQGWAPTIVELGVLLVGVGALWFQIGALRKQLTIQNFSDYTKRYQEIILHFPEDVNERTFKLKARDNSEYIRTMRYMRAYFDLCYEEYYLRTRKLIDKELWSVWEGGMKVAFGKPAFQQAWAIIREDSEYGDTFESFVNNAMESAFSDAHER